MSAGSSLSAVQSRHVELGKQSTALSKQGKYAEAADLLEKFEKEIKDQKVEASTLKFLADGIAVLRQRAAWAAKASSDFQSAQRLMLELLNQLRWDVDTAKVQDARVQELLAFARKLDPKTKALFGPEGEGGGAGTLTQRFAARCVREGDRRGSLGAWARRVSERGE